MNKIGLSTAALALSLCTTAAIAAPIDASTLNLSELQGLFDNRTQGGVSSINTNHNEAGAELFSFQSTGAEAIYMATASYTASYLEFGIYDHYNPGATLTIFNNNPASTFSSIPGDSATIKIKYNSPAPGINKLQTYIEDTVTGDLTKLDQTNFQSNVFGFYITGVSGTWYSENYLNALNGDVNGDGIDDNDHFLTYYGQGDSVDAQGSGTFLNDLAHWYIATEATDMAGTHPSYSDFTDLVVQFESAQPVPAPATVLLFGAGLLGLAGLVRRKNKQSK